MSESPLTSPLPLELGEHQSESSVAGGERSPGQAVHFDAAGSYEVWPGVRAGLAGYYRKQITDARIGGHTVPDRRNGSGRSGPAWSCPGRILPLPRRPLRGRRGESLPREEARVASVEGILMADPRSWVAVSRRGDQRLLTGHEKMAWMLRAFLAAESV